MTIGRLAFPCLTSSDNYFIHIQDEPKLLTINTKRDNYDLRDKGWSLLIATY